MRNLKKIIAIAALTVASFSSTASLINFDDQNLSSYGIEQDTYGDVSTSADTLTLTGDQWKSIDLSFSVTENTLLEFDIFSSHEGEIMGIGLDDKIGIDSNRTFKLAGTQDWGISDFDTYSIGDGWMSYSINIGDYYTGVFDRMFFVMDNDAGSSLSNVSFRNVQVCEPLECVQLSNVTAVSAPATMSLMAFGLFAVFMRKRAKNT
jgi:hypothetical protein